MLDVHLHISVRGNKQYLGEVLKFLSARGRQPLKDLIKFVENDNILMSL